MKAILQNITLGAPLPDPLDSQPLHIYCVNAPNQIRYRFDSGPWRDSYHACSQPFQKHGLSPAGSIGPNIILCPAFFKKPPVPLKPQCIKLNRSHGAFRGPRNSTDDIPQSAQIWILLRELTRHYLNLKNDRDKNRDVDVRDVNDCVRLPAQWAKLNAGNYVYYVSSRFSNQFNRLDSLKAFFGGDIWIDTNIDLLTDVHSKCWIFPSRGSRRSEASVGSVGGAA